MRADQLSLDLNLLKQVASKKVKLSPTGFGLCPFHEEKTPSFNVFQADSGKAKYHCFGCGADGDVFDYLSLMEGLNFRNAREYLLELLAFPTLSSSLSWNTGATPGGISEGEFPPTFCERDCPKYAALREDYNAILEELNALRGPTPPPQVRDYDKLLREYAELRKDFEACLKELMFLRSGIKP